MAENTDDSECFYIIKFLSIFGTKDSIGVNVWSEGLLFLILCIADRCMNEYKYMQNWV